MKHLKSILIIALCLFLGNILSSVIDFPVPESVYGMIILFIGLLTKVVKPEDVDVVTAVLLGGLAMFFAPGGVGLMVKFDAIKDIVVPFVAILVITTFITMVVTIKTVQILRKIGGKK